MEEREANENVLDRVDAQRRGFVKRLLAGAAFATPVLATFAIDALTARSAQAQTCPNCTYAATPEPSTVLLMAAGAVGIGIAAHRKAKRKNQAPEESGTAGPSPRD